MSAVYRKELGQFFHSLTGYIYLTIFLLLSGCYFILYNLLPANGSISVFFSQLMFPVIFLLPVLTMRTYAEEHKMKTIQLLMSSPISSFSIALGKFFAVLTVFGIGAAFTLIYVAVLAAFGQFEPIVILGNYIGMTVSASAFIAIGLFISLLTETQITACIITYSVLLSLWLIGMAETYLTHPLLKQLVHQLSIANRFSEFSMGIFDFSILIYYLSITVFFLFLICVMTEKNRQHSFGIRTAVLSLLGIALLLSGNHLSGQLSAQFGLRMDMTSNKLYELSDETNQILNQLDDKVQIRVFSSESDFLPLIREVLEQYRLKGNGAVTVEYIDPYSNPVLVDSYIQRGYSIELGSIIVEQGIYARAFTLEEMFSMSGSGNSVQEIKCEQLLSSAVLYVSGGDTLSAVFLSGHNETPSDSLKELLTQNNFETRTLSLSMEEIPADTSLLIIASPTADFSREEIQALDAYTASCGRILAFVGPSAKELPNLQEFLAEWGMGLTGITAAEELQYTDTNPLSIVPVYSAHAINQYFSGNQLYLSMPSSTALDALFLSQGGIRTQKLLYSTDKAYDAEHREDGAKGPFTLALTAEKKQDEQKTRIVLIGSSGIYSDSLMQAENYGNAKFLAQTLRWCTETDTVLSIPPKTIGNAQLVLPASQVIPLAVLFLAVIPFSVLLFGMWCCHRRKHS